MSPDKQPITKDNLLAYIKELAKEFRKLNGTATPAEIVLIGGAAVLAEYGFREMTYDIDAIIVASSVMKDAINRVGDRHGLPTGWLNADFQRTSSYSAKLLEHSEYLKTFSNVLTVRAVSAEYLLAMKLMSGRHYKYDLSDIVGILWEHQKKGAPITRDMVDGAIAELYGGNAIIPENSAALLDAVMGTADYEALYGQVRESEEASKAYLLELGEQYPDALKGGNLDEILSRRKPGDGSVNDSFLAKLDGFKKKAVEQQSLPQQDHSRAGDSIE